MLVVEEVGEVGEDGDLAGCGPGAVDVDFGEVGVEVAVGKDESVAAGFVGVAEKGRVVGTAAEGTLEGGGPADAGVLDGEEAGVRWAAEGARSDQRGGAADGDARDVWVLVGEALVDGGDVGGEGLGDAGVEPGVAHAGEEAIEGLVLELGLDALGAERLRVELGSVEEGGGVFVRGEAEVGLEVAGADVLELMGELVVKVAGLEDELVADKVLIDAEIEGAGAGGAEWGDGVLLDVGGVAESEEGAVEGGELGGERGLLDTGGGVGAEAGAVEVAVGVGDDGDKG